MLAPNVASGVEEPDDRARAGVVARDVRTLMPIAVKTGQRQIPNRRPPSMLARNDVVEMEWQRIKASRQVAIFAPVLGAPPDFPGKPPIHGLVVSASRAFDLITASRLPTCK